MKHLAPTLAFVLIVEIFAANSFAQKNPDFLTKSYINVEYVTNLPEQIFGIGIAAINKDRTGVFVNFKTGPIFIKKSNFMSNISVDFAENMLHDHLTALHENWISLNFGFTKVMSEEIAVYFGAGISAYTTHKRYANTSGAILHYSDYWIQDSGNSKLTGNILTGFYTPVLRKLCLHLGAELNPAGLTIGLGYLF